MALLVTVATSRPCGVNATVTSPDLSVRYTCIPSRARAASTLGTGWPYRFGPTLTTATTARTVATNSGSDVSPP